jgi:hypothetical protein
MAGKLKKPGFMGFSSCSPQFQQVTSKLETLIKATVSKAEIVAFFIPFGVD